MKSWRTPVPAGLKAIEVYHTHHGPAFVTAEFHVAAIDAGDDAAATFDASSIVGDDGHPAGEFPLRSASMRHTYHSRHWLPSWTGTATFQDRRLSPTTAPFSCRYHAHVSAAHAIHSTNTKTPPTED
jgi:hypothetical protein